MLRVLLAALLLTAAPPARAADTLIAAATNFADAGAEIVRAFEAHSPHRATITFGSTGKLYAQIMAGAPFDIFLAADQARPQKLVDARRVSAGARFTYAIGGLALWSADENWPPAASLATVLRAPRATKIAIANPALAPYGLAAEETLRALGLWPAMQPRIVMGENVGQAFALVATGNAPLGFVARSQLSSKQAKRLGGRHWLVPNSLHKPIRQDGVRLKRDVDNPAAKDFQAFLQSAAAGAILQRFGYSLPSD